MEINSKWFVKDYSGIVFKCCPLFAMDTRNVIVSIQCLYSYNSTAIFAYANILRLVNCIARKFHFVVFSFLVGDNKIKKMLKMLKRFFITA